MTAAELVAGAVVLVLTVSLLWVTEFAWGPRRGLWHSLFIGVTWAIFIGAEIVVYLWLANQTVKRPVKLQVPRREAVREPTLAMEVVRAAGRVGLPSHLALELAQAETGIRRIDRREGQQLDCGVMQVAFPLDMPCGRLSDEAGIELGVRMAGYWYGRTGGRLEDWPRARQAYRQGHLQRSER
jgi:hypothetical protein